MSQPLEYLNIYWELAFSHDQLSLKTSLLNHEKLLCSFIYLIKVYGINMLTLAPGPYLVVSLTTITSLQRSTLYGVPTLTSSAKPISTLVNSTGIWFIDPDGSEHVPPQISLLQYLAVAFLPLFLAIFYSIPWRLIENTTRHMEPIYQLQSPTNAATNDPLTLDYESPLILTLPFIAFSQRHYAVLASSSISIILILTSSLASQVLFVSESNACGPDRPAPCDTWAIYPAVARLIQVLLGAIAGLVFFLIISGFRRKTGVYSEPLSIVGLAALYQRSPLLRTLHGVNLEIGRLHAHRQRLSTSKLGLLGYGPLPRNRTGKSVRSTQASENPSGAAITNRSARKGGILAAIQNTLSAVWQGLSSFPAWIWPEIKCRLLYIFTFLLLSGILSMISFYYHTTKDSGFERFMDSEGFGVRFLMTLIGAGTNLLWSKIDSGKCTSTIPSLRSSLEIISQTTD
jgi:hypothetical protein